MIILIRECNDPNPKTVKREIRFQKNVIDTVLLCTLCKDDSLYSNFISEVSVK